MIGNVPPAMRYMRHLAIVLMALALAVPGIVPAMSQTWANAYTSPLTGSTIRASGNWAIDTSVTDTATDYEILTLHGMNQDFLLLAFFPANTDLSAARNEFLDAFLIDFDAYIPVDRGAYANVSYSLEITSAGGYEYGAFTLFMGQRSSGFVEVYFYYAPVMSVGAGLADAQQSVTIDGEPVFGGVDGPGLQGHLSANAGRTGASTETPVTSDPILETDPARRQELASALFEDKRLGATYLVEEGAGSVAFDSSADEPGVLSYLDYPVQDFYVNSEFCNPWDATEAPLTYGFQFGTPNPYYALAYISTSGEWFLYSTGDLLIASGTISGVVTDETGCNDAGADESAGNGSTPEASSTT